MQRTHLILIWKTIPLLCAFSFSLLMFICIFFVNGTISALPFVASYIDAGKSIFIPFVPKINLFCFLPEAAQVLPFTFGHLIDFVIIVNTLMVINPIALPFYKKVNNEYRNEMFYDLHLGAVNTRQRAVHAMLDAPCTIMLDRQSSIDDQPECCLQAGASIPPRCAWNERRVHGRVLVTRHVTPQETRGFMPERVLASTRARHERAGISSISTLRPTFFARYR